MKKEETKPIVKKDDPFAKNTMAKKPEPVEPKPVLSSNSGSVPKGLPPGAKKEIVPEKKEAPTTDKLNPTKKVAANPFGK